MRFISFSLSEDGEIGHEKMSQGRGGLYAAKAAMLPRLDASLSEEFLWMEYIACHSTGFVKLKLIVLDC